MALQLTVIRIAISLRKVSDKVAKLVPGKILGNFRLLPLFFGLGAFLQFKAFRLADQEEINDSESSFDTLDLFLRSYRRAPKANP